MKLTQTKRWSEFVEWYIATFKQNAYSQIVALYDGQSFDSFTVTSNYDNDWYINFAQLEFEFQEGVYRKFIESLGYKISIHNYYYDNEVVYSVEIKGFVSEWSSFEKLIEEIFTNTN